MRTRSSLPMGSYKMGGGPGGVGAGEGRAFGGRPGESALPFASAPGGRMLPRVRAQLEAHAGDPDQPERATLALTRALLSGFPRQRPITLALLGLAPHPGLTPTPWALDGVLEACVEAERTPLRLLTLA